MKYFSRHQKCHAASRKFLYATLCLVACLPQVVGASSTNSNSACTASARTGGEYKHPCRYPRKGPWSYGETIIIAADEVVEVNAVDTGRKVVAVLGGYRRSTIINHGEISLTVTNTEKAVPYPDNGYGKSYYRHQQPETNSYYGWWHEEYVDPWMPTIDGIALDAVGIAGGYGDDVIKNYGLLTVAASTTLTDEPGIAQSYSIGISGNEGEDHIANIGQINVTSNAEVRIDDVTFSLVDSGDARRQAFAMTKGITGNEDSDKIINEGQIAVTANATVDTSAFNVSLISGVVDVDGGSEAQASATGIDNGDGGDHVDNQGTLTVTANAVVESDQVSIDLIELPDAESVQAPLTAKATAVGIYGAGGDERDDLIRNSGTLNVTANARVDALDVNVTGLSLADGGVNTASEAIALGINGSTDWDKIVNDGDITVRANATTNPDSVEVTVFDLSFIPPLFGVESDQVVTTATSQATGIQAGGGDDRVVNNAVLQVESNAKIDVDDYSVSLLGLSSDVNRTATAHVTGISGGRGYDYIENNGQIIATSNAKLDLFNLSVDLISLDDGLPGFASEIEGSNRSLAYATGIDGGDGDDDLKSMGTLSVTADASNNAWDLDLSAVKLSSADTSTNSEASATGIDGGKGRSRISNSGAAIVDANATTDTKSLSFTLVDLTFIPDAIDLVTELFTGNSGADTSTTAKADAVGIKTDFENDKIINDGSLTVTADSITKTFEMSMSLDGVSNFTELDAFVEYFLDEPLVDASTTADAGVTGITSGSGHDKISNAGTISAKAKADVSAISVGVDLPLPSLSDVLPDPVDFVFGLVPNIDTTEVETGASAQAVGINSGDGYDRLLNDGSVHSEATANASSLSVNATVGVALPDGDDDDGPGLPSISLEANLVDVSARSDAEAVGISTGDGEDAVKSKDVTAKAATQSLATNIAATVAYADDNISIAGSLANASTESKARAEGITTGEDDDLLHSTGNLVADSYAKSLSTAVTAKGQLVKDTWVGIGASVTKADTEAESVSQAVNLGAGDDSALNEGSITAKAHNNSDAVGVDVGVTVQHSDNFGIIGEGNWASTDTLATSFADGMLGGAGRDYISNSGTVVADALARPNSVSVAANATGTKKGATIGIALTQAKTQGTATSHGISGGEDEDWLVNSGTVKSKAKTDTVAASVSASLALTDKGVALTGTAVDGSTDATSTASGISGDEAEDYVDNKGTVDVLADANAVSGSVSVSAQGANKGVALGLALSRATSEATADSQGISGGLQNDEIHSSGSVKSHAKAIVIGGSLAVAGGGTSKGLTVEGAAADGSTTGKVSAVGISGEQGRDYIVNQGSVDALADVLATSVSVGVTANGTSQGATIGIALGRATSKAEAVSDGISGGSDSDYIASSGSLKSHALSKVISGSAALAAGGSSKGITVEGAGVDAATDAISTAKGISGDEGYVEIVNTGDLDVLADANAVSASAAVTASGTGTGINFGLGLARATSIAEADSTGISGGIYGDLLYSEGSVKSHAKSLVVAGSAALAAGGTGKGLDIKGAGADGTTRGKSTAVGFNGENGDDYIESKGAVDVLADANTTSASVSIAASGTGTGLAVGIAVARARSEAEADGTGIEGGLGNDHIQSSGALKSHAKSLVIAGSGALAGGGAGKGVSAQGVGVDAQTSGLSDAQGISGGEGRDYVLVEDEIDVLADTSTTSIGVAVTANGTGTGLTFGLGLARAGAAGEAISHGVSGGEDDDILLSNEPIKAHAKSLVIAGSGGLAAGGTGKGVTITGAAVDAASNGQSTARGVSGDNGKDIIVNHDMVDVLADTDTTSVGLAVTANGTGAGVSLGIGLARATTIANADSSGISGGEDDDQILNNGLVKSHATSDVIAGSAALAGTFTGKGVALSGAAADASTLGNAHASGISGDLGVDEIFNKGDLDVLADSAATSVSVGASAAFTAAGVGLGVSLARTDTKADANSTGISLGGEADAPEEVTEPEWKKYKYMKAGMKGCRSKHGHRKYNSRWKRRKHCGGYEPEPIERTQIAVNSGRITSKTIADADSVSVSVQVGFTGAGVQAGAALADASTRATATSMGIEGSGHKDIIVNQNSIDSIAGADATTTSVAVNFNAGVKSLTLSVALTDATANANATSIGIAGLGGDDIVGNSGGITAKSTADTNAVAVSVPLSLSIVPLSAAFANADAKASADANAINGGSGNDYLESSGVLLADANSNADGISVSVAPIGVALVGANITAEANAVGIEGANGDDVIFQKETGSLTANSSVTATGTTIAATVLGVAGGFDNKSTAISQSTGISAGSGNNKTVNLGSISTDANSKAIGTSVSAALTGVTIANTTTIANTYSTGIQGGEDQDLILNQGSILVLGSSKTIGTSVGASVDPVSFADTTSSSVTRNTGISGGDGDDDILNLGSIDVTGSSTSTGTSVGVALRYAAFADASTSSTTYGTGISGDAGLDNILNLESIKAKANSKATGTSVSAGLAGATFADSNTDATSYSTGISAGAGLDNILNFGSIQSGANSTATGTTVSGNLAGAAFADNNTNATTHSTGISAGEGLDNILNLGSIQSEANSTATGTAVSATLAGASFAESNTSANSYSSGISAGAGLDNILNLDSIKATANSTASGTSVGVGVVGASFADLSSKAESKAIGIATGTGEDKLLSKATISAVANATANGTSVAAGLIGFSDGDASTTVTANAMGIDLGSGDDEALSEGAIDIAANSNSKVTTGSGTLVGAANSKANTTSTVAATGIDGGAGNDLIINKGSITIGSGSTAGPWMSNLTSTSFSLTIAGAANSESTLFAKTESIGVDGGAGDDRIFNAGDLNIAATSFSSTSNTSIGIFGAAGNEGGSGAITNAAGIIGGDGLNKIQNTAFIDVTAKAAVELGASSYTFAGASSSVNVLAAQSLARGIMGGSDADIIESTGIIRLDANSTMTSSNKSDVTFGSAAGNATSGSVSKSIGIDGGDEDDVIRNFATVNISSSSTVSSNSSAYAFAGGSATDAAMTGKAESIGIYGGRGSDEIYNKGAVLVDTSAEITSRGGVKTTFGGPDASGLSVASTKASGIDGAEGDDIIVSEGRIAVTAFADATSTNNAEGGWLIGDGETGSFSKTTVNGFGIVGGEGANTIQNRGDIEVNTSGIAYSFAYASGAHLSWDGDGEALADSRITSNAVGISAGNGNNAVINEGKLTILAEASTVKTISTTIRFWSEEENPDEGSPPTPIKTVDSKDLPDSSKRPEGETIFWTKDPRSGEEGYVAAYRNVADSDDELHWVHINGFIVERTIELANAETYAAANGNGVTGTGKATALANSSATAYGIKLGNGDNQIWNKNEMNITASPEAMTHVTSDGDAFGDAIGTTRSHAYARAYGISAGSGNNLIANDATINVTASPVAKAHSEVSGGDICIWFFGWWCGGGGDGIGSATSTFDSLAVGIMTGDGVGKNEITNNGILNVSSSPVASGFTTRVEGDSSPAFSTSVFSKAIGIWTKGDGESRILNKGEINVTARDLPINYSCSRGNCSRRIEAIGIWTGDGNDHVFNEGSIVVDANGSAPIEVAIRTSGGDDMVVLGENSSVTGAIDLGANDDALHIFNTPVVNGSISGGSGTDTAVFIGTGTFANVLSDFENAVKQGAGTYTLPALPSMENIEIEEGLLEIESTYQLAAGSSITPSVSSGAGQGALVINGALDISNGKIDIVIGTGHHIDGDRQSVLTASEGIINSLSENNIKLPEPSPLLSFYDEMTADALNIQSSVKPFKTVANSSNEEAIANYMDDLLPEAEGDVSVALGEIQVMQAGEHAGAFSSLNPESYISSQQALEFGVKNHMSTLRQRTRGLRNLKYYDDFIQPGFVSVEASTGFGAKGSDTLFPKLGLVQSNYQSHGSWTKSHLQSGQLDQTAANSGFDYDNSGYSFGFDQRLDEHRIVGFSIANNTTNLTTDDNRGRSDIESQLASIYGSYTGDTGFLEGVVSSGYNTFDSGRTVTIGSINTSASSEHSGNFYAASIGGGLFIPVTSWDIEAYSTLHYQRHEEDGFKEEGAGGIGLDVKSRDSNLLSSEFGFRFAKLFANRERKLFTEFGIAWLHELEDDRSIEVAFVDTPESTFSVDAQDIDDDGISFNAGLKYTGRKGIVGSAEFRTELREDYSDQILSTSIQYQFD